MNPQTRLVPRWKSRVHHQAVGGKRPEIEIMEPRILLSRDLVGSARQRLHLAFTAHAAAASGRLASPDNAHPGHTTQTGPVQGATAYAIPGAPGQSVEVTFTLTERQAWYHNEVGQSSRRAIAILDPLLGGHTGVASPRRDLARSLINRIQNCRVMSGSCHPYVE